MKQAMQKSNELKQIDTIYQFANSVKIKKQNNGETLPILEEKEINSYPKKTYILPQKQSKNKGKGLDLTDNKDLVGGGFDDEKNETLNKNMNKKEYCNKLGLERINFQFDEYGVYPDESFQPSIFFFKFLAMKPDLEKELIDARKKVPPKLKLYIPDTIVLNDLDSNYWIYTDANGFVNRIEETDADVIEKFKSEDKDDNELIGVSKIPIIKGTRVDENKLDLLNIEELEKCLFSKSGSQIAIQRFVKCRGPKAFICRSVWRKEKPPFIYILTNKAKYYDNVEKQDLKYVVNSREPNSYFAFYSTSGKHLEETMIYMKNIVKFVEAHSDIILDELVGDFLKDEAGIWWFINLKALKITNISKFRKETGEICPLPYLDFFINRQGLRDDHHSGITRKFDYQTKIKCKFCGVDFSKKNLKYKLTTKMILETDKMLRHVDLGINKFYCIDRPDLKHNDYSMIYLPFRVCEDCFLLFETLNYIKNYQIIIANLFKNPVNKINFGFGFYSKPQKDTNKIILTQQEIQNIDNIDRSLDSSSNLSPDRKEYDHLKSLNQKANNLYRILIMFNDLIWSDKIPIPQKDLFLLYNFFGSSYKVPIKREEFSQDLDYTIINFKKIYHIICTEPEGFIDYVEKNRHMEIRLGHFEISEEETKKHDVKKLLRKEIIIEDPDVYDEREKFIQFASVDLSLQGLKYGTNYRNMLNGLLFKRDEPHYVGKLRCLIRIHKVKEIKEMSRYILQKHFNLFIPPVNFVVSDELPDYWIELVERQKLRETALNEIMRVMKKHKIKYKKDKHKKEVFQTLETLVSYYSSKGV